MIDFIKPRLQVTREVIINDEHVGNIWMNKVANYKFVPKGQDPKTFDGYWWPTLQYAQHTAAITSTYIEDRCYGSFTTVTARWRDCVKRQGKFS
jgi:hypothetical protein